MCRTFIGVTSILLIILCTGCSTGAAENANTDIVDAVIVEDAQASAPIDETVSEETSDTALFLRYWQAWLDLSENKRPSVLEYRCETVDWFGRRLTERKIISLSEDRVNADDSQNMQTASDIFGVLRILDDESRIYNAKREQEHIFSFLLVSALSLSERERTCSLDLQTICQMFLDQQGRPRPRRFVFRGEVPKESGSIVKQIQIVYTWDYHRFGDGDLFWLPVDINIEMLAQRGGRQAKMFENWKLTSILKLDEGELGDPRMANGRREIGTQK